MLSLTDFRVKYETLVKESSSDIDRSTRSQPDNMPWDKLKFEIRKYLNSEKNFENMESSKSIDYLIIFCFFEFYQAETGCILNQCQLSLSRIQQPISLGRGINLSWNSVHYLLQRGCWHTTLRTCSLRNVAAAMRSESLRRARAISAWKNASEAQMIPWFWDTMVRQGKTYLTSYQKNTPKVYSCPPSQIASLLFRCDLCMLVSSQTESRYFKDDTEGTPHCAFNLVRILVG